MDLDKYKGNRKELIEWNSKLKYEKLTEKELYELEYPKTAEYWIDGIFTSAWTQKAWYSHDRGLFVPKRATIRREVNRIYIDNNFVKAMILKRNTKILRNTDKNDLHLIAFVKALNTPWVKEYDPPFEVSLP